MRKYTNFTNIKGTLDDVRRETGWIIGGGGRITRIAPATWESIWPERYVYSAAGGLHIARIIPTKIVKHTGYRVDYVTGSRRYYRSLKGSQSRRVAAAAIKADTGINEPLPLDVIEGDWADKPIDEDDQPRWSSSRRAVKNSADKRKRLSDRRKARKAKNR